jgi:hypothetical protein
LELPNYVLEGNSLAVETNVSVEECKCYCIDAPHRYGMDCQSVQYYYDSQTCLINKENRFVFLKKILHMEWFSIRPRDFKKFRRAERFFQCY